MRMFYEEWSDLDSASGTALIEQSSNLALASAKSADASDSAIWHYQVPKNDGFPATEFFSIGFTQHRIIFEKVKDKQERCFYIRHCAEQHYTVEELKQSIAGDDYHHQGSLPNNFMRTISAGQQALKAISTFKDEYLLDYINVEELNVRDSQDIMVYFSGAGTEPKHHQQEAAHQ